MIDFYGPIAQDGRAIDFPSFDPRSVHQFDMATALQRKTHRLYFRTKRNKHRKENRRLLNKDKDLEGRYTDCDLGCGGQMSWCNCCKTWSSNCCVPYGTCQCSYIINKTMNILMWLGIILLVIILFIGGIVFGAYLLIRYLLIKEFWDNLH